jgi:uncharacterized protein (TIGR03032 family)
MGLAASADGQVVWMSTAYPLWRRGNALPPGAHTEDGADRVLMPTLARTIGDIDVHDIALDAAGEPIFVNTLFSCLCRPTPTGRFRVVWRPPFISRLAAEDRGHLNGLAVRDGAPAFVSALAATDFHEGWRGRRVGGGVIVDVASGEIAVSGLSMPHSPRWHNGRLYVLNSGAGEFGTVDLATGRFVPICGLPGYGRGLALAQGVPARCGLAVIDLRSGDLVHSPTLDGFVPELYDVVALPGVVQPMALGFKTDEIRRTYLIEG